MGRAATPHSRRRDEPSLTTSRLSPARPGGPPFNPSRSATLAKTTDFDYKRYLASREWGVLREAVKRRASITGESDCAVCERCENAPVDAFTYEL